MSIHSMYLSSNLWHTPSPCVQGTQGSRPVLAGAVAADPVWLARDGVQGAVSEALPSAGPSPAQYVLCTGHSHFYQHCVHIQACSEGILYGRKYWRDLQCRFVIFAFSSKDWQSLSPGMTDREGMHKCAHV